VSADPLPARSISGTMAARVGVLAGGLVSGIVTARALGPSGRGQYFAVTTAAAILAQLATLGMTSSNVFLGARDRTRIKPLLMNSFALAAGVGVLSGCIVAVFGSFLAASIGIPRSMLWAVSVLSAATLLWTLATTLLVAAERFDAMNTWQLVNTLVAVVAIVACAALHGSPAQFAFAASIAAVVTALGASLSVASQPGGGPLRCSLALVRQGLGFSARAYFVLVLGYLLQRSGATLLVASGSPTEVGQYSVASQVVDVLLIIPGSVALVLYPRLVRRSEDLWPQVRRTAMLTTLSMVALCVIAALTAPVILPAVFGRDFATSAATLWGLLPGVVALSIVAVLSQYLVARAFPAVIVAAWGAGLALAVISGVPLIHSYGAIGAAASQSCGAALVCVLLVAIARRRRTATAQSGPQS
jgi:O-antigen/teichoic acid export membrane protein